MAQVIATKILSDKGVADRFKVISAGVAAWPGSHASPEAIEVVAQQGMDLTQHRAQQLSRELAQEADIVLTMTVNHKNFVLLLAPEAAERVYTLKEYVFGGEGQAADAPVDTDITDPFGQGPEVYRVCAAELTEQIEKAIERFLEELGQVAEDEK